MKGALPLPVFAAWILAVLGGITAFNLIIGVFGFHEAVGALILFVVFAIYTASRKQPQGGGPHA